MCRRMFGRCVAVSAPTSVVGARASRTHPRSRVVYRRHRPCAASRRAVPVDARRCSRSRSPWTTGLGHDVHPPAQAATSQVRNWRSTWVVGAVETCVRRPAGPVLVEVQRLGQLLGAPTPLRRGPRGPYRAPIGGPGELIGADFFLQGPRRGSTPPRRGSTPPWWRWGMPRMVIGDPLRAPDAGRSAPSGVAGGVVGRPRADRDPEHGDGDGDPGCVTACRGDRGLPHRNHTVDHPP